MPYLGKRRRTTGTSITGTHVRWPAAVVFDFDGVILESADIKHQIFLELFAKYPRHLPAILELNERLGGISRYRKFEMIYNEILGLPLLPAECERMGQQFSELALAKVLACPMVRGSQNFLEQHSGRTPMFVVSGTPDDELRTIMRARRLDHYFLEIHGSPRTKKEILLGVLDRYRWRSDSVMFVGDAWSDYLAAEEIHAVFVGRVVKGRANPFPAEVPVVQDLGALGALMPRLAKRYEI